VLVLFGIHLYISCVYCLLKDVSIMLPGNHKKIMRMQGRPIKRIRNEQAKNEAGQFAFSKGHEKLPTLHTGDEKRSKTTEDLGSTTSVTIVDFRTGSTRVLPAVGHYEDVVPVTPLLSPSAGDTTFFARHHVTNLKLGGASFQEAICSGRLCDRQMEKKAAGWKCGCFYQNKENKLVVEMEVGLEVPLSFDPSGTKVVRNFRSL
jgi:hypothetical protein